MRPVRVDCSWCACGWTLSTPPSQLGRLFSSSPIVGVDAGVDSIIWRPAAFQLVSPTTRASSVVGGVTVAMVAGDMLRHRAGSNPSDVRDRWGEVRFTAMPTTPPRPRPRLLLGKPFIGVPSPAAAAAAAASPVAPPPSPPTPRLLGVRAASSTNSRASSFIGRTSTPSASRCASWK